MTIRPAMAPASRRSTMSRNGRARGHGMFGHWASRWRVIRTSNAYVFRDPQQRPEGVPASKSENPAGTRNQEIQILTAVIVDRNLRRGAAIGNDANMFRVRGYEPTTCGAVSGILHNGPVSRNRN